MNTTSNTSNTANKTEIFNSYKDFLKREDKSINGVSAGFAESYPDWESMNSNNIGCYNCYNCNNCNNCNICNRCNHCYNCNNCNNCYNCNNCSHCNSCNDCNHCNSCNVIARWKPDVITTNNVVNLLAIHGLLWPVAISETHMQIGCQNHSIAAWKRFSKSDLAHMGNTVIDFYKQNKQLILAAIAVKQSSVSQ